MVLSTSSSLVTTGSFSLPETGARFTGLIDSNVFNIIDLNINRLQAVALNQITFLNQYSERTLFHKLSFSRQITHLLIENSYIPMSLNHLMIAGLKSFSFVRSGLCFDGIGTLTPFIKTQWRLEEFKITHMNLDQPLLDAINPSIQVLDFSHCYINSSAILHKILSFSKLRELNLTGCGLDPQLEESKQLFYHSLLSLPHFSQLIV